MTVKTEILCQNFAHFGGFRASILTILGQKIVFWTFSKFLKSCFASDWVLILTIKDLLFPVF